MRNVYVFVANADELLHYQNALKDYPQLHVVKGVLGITNQRNFIRLYFPPKTNIVSIDDDVEYLMKLEKNEKLVRFKPKELHTFIEEAFKLAKTHHTGLWGIFPTPNPFYMKGQKASSTSLKFVIGTFYGFVNSEGDINIGDIKEKEDVEMTIQYYKRDGGILRFNHISFKTKFKNPNGGLGGIEDRFEANKHAAEYLIAKYPCCTRLKVRKNGMHEVVLRLRGKGK